MVPRGFHVRIFLPICGRPLIAHSICLARKLSSVDNVFVSTDSDEISSIAFQYGAEVISRPPDLASDTASEWLAWQHAIDHVLQSGYSFDRFLSLPATAPLRNSDDVQRCLDALQKGIDIVITISPASRNPWFNMKLQQTNNIM